ncbi:phosphatidylinositol phosphatase PTPRQ [Cotesia glomerata]|uniref:phosphatidylinositol phosphatase PTPRQ n=1 Tax=Cotesia glomerata TaxID=32391 RepID=UPI001D027677|nr:phosphatidylinositol phosphatase PTPRQ [Cotesia glomerata]
MIFRGSSAHYCFNILLITFSNLRVIDPLKVNNISKILSKYPVLDERKLLTNEVFLNDSSIVDYEKLFNETTIFPQTKIKISSSVYPVNYNFLLENETTTVPSSALGYQAENSNTVSEINNITSNNGKFNDSVNREIPEPPLSKCDEDFVDNDTNDNSNEENNDGGNSIFKYSTEYNLVVGDLLITSSNDSSLTVEWKPPTNSSDFEYYILKWTGGSSTSKCYTANTTTNYTITHLQSCTKYVVSVSPAKTNNTGQDITVIGITRLIVDKDQLNLKITGNSTDWLAISWYIPGRDDCIIKNVITYCHTNLCEEANVTQTLYNATNLLPCTTYHFSVSLHGENGEFGSTNISGVTGFLKPSAPSSAWSLPQNDSLIIFWSKPIGASCVILYRITIYQDHPYNNAFKENTTTGYQIMFNNLQSCSVYNVIIVPIDQFGNDSSPYIFYSNKTLAPIPEVPLYLSSDPGKNEIAIAWQLDINEFNNCGNMKILTVCNYNKVLGLGYNGTNSSSSINITEEFIQRIITTTINSLSPHTEYECFSITSNDRKNSSKSDPVLLKTSEDISTSPELSVFNNTDKKFSFIWKLPVYLPGHISKFEVNFTWYYKFHQPIWCSNFSGKSEYSIILNGSTSSLSYEKAYPFSSYQASIRAKTLAGWGNYSDSVSFATHPGAPGPVSNLTYIFKKVSDDATNLEAFLSWGLPCFINAVKIEHFVVTGIGTRNNFPNHDLNATIMSQICIDDMCTVKLQLKDEYTYYFSVAGKVKDVKSLGVAEEITLLYPAGVPSDPKTEYLDQITIDPYKTRKTTYSATILLPLFLNTHGEIRCYAVIVAKAGFNYGNFSRNDLKAGEWPSIASWIESAQKGFTIPYQASKFCNDSHEPHVVDYGKLKAIKFQIGEDIETCPELSKIKVSYCNGPLNPDTWYDVRMRAFTDGGYRDSRIFQIKTNAELQVSLIIGSIVGILSVGVLITIFLLVKKCSVQTVLRRLLNSNMPGSPVPAPFNRRKFIIHCQQLADNPGKLSNEFQLLQTLSLDLQMPTNAGCLHANRKKNRYADILPYDFSRVKLDIIDNDPNSDYINASFIKGFSNEEEYIACQAPKEETTYDFWRMVEQYNVRLIIMLTSLIENNKEKCCQYFPTIRETFTYEKMSIRCSSEFDYRSYTQRTLVLQKDEEKRIIVHLQFKDWPDHDVPEDFDAMINFCQIMRRNINASRNLVVIHCSAGIGRTGTLIAIDIILQHLKDNRKLDVFGTVYRLRQQRINMVQRESQYTFIYNCIKQVLKNPHFSKSYKPPYGSQCVRPSYEDKSELKHSNVLTINQNESIELDSDAR